MAIVPACHKAIPQGTDQDQMISPHLAAAIIRQREQSLRLHER
jgi:hypothetical protein